MGKRLRKYYWRKQNHTGHYHNFTINNMYCCIHTLSDTPCIYFFQKDGTIIAHDYMDKNIGYIDFVSSFSFWTEIKDIFFVSGPAKFTSLRNLSVFLQILQSFSHHHYRLYRLSTFQFLSFVLDCSSFFLPISTREGFLFDAFGRYKKISLAERETLPNIATYVPNTQILPQVFVSMLRQKDIFYTDTISIEYGAEANIGT